MQVLHYDINGNIIDDEEETPCKKEKNKMKIDVAAIEHCALLAISEQVNNPWEYCEREDKADGMRLVALGAVAGICELADKLKKVLEA